MKLEQPKAAPALRFNFDVIGPMQRESKRKEYDVEPDVGLLRVLLCRTPSLILHQIQPIIIIGELSHFDGALLYTCTASEEPSKHVRQQLSRRLARLCTNRPRRST